MLELPDFRKISFPEMPPIPLEEVVTDASHEVSSRITFVCSGPPFLLSGSTPLLPSCCASLKPSACLRYSPSYPYPSLYENDWFLLLSSFIQAVDLLKKFLVYDSHKRISANEVSGIANP